MNGIKYSIILGAYQHLEDATKPCLESIKKYTDLSNVEVIIVANGCGNDGTREYVENLGSPFKLIWFDEPQGYAGANNAGIKEAKGDYLILCNNDIILLEQPVNQWIEMLEKPFLTDPLLGLSGPILGHSDPAGRDFLVFFCVMIARKVFDKIGLLDMSFGVGAGEDTAFCVEAENAGFKMVQVPEGQTEFKDGFVIGGFKIFHQGEKTVHDKALVSNWSKIFDENSLKLAKKYNPEWYKWRISNNSERAVFGKNDSVEPWPREIARYTYAANNLSGKKVLEFGCSSGYALKFLPKDIEYTGVDYDKTIIEYAQDNFGREGIKFVCSDIHDFEFKEHYDVIIAYEFIEHIIDGKEWAQKLKQHCDQLFITIPYMEPSSAPWGPWHKIWELSEKDFPDFEYKYVLENGEITDKPRRADGLNLLLMQWKKGEKYIMVDPKPTILAFVPTKNRYNILSNCLQAIAMQTLSPDKVLIYDDGEHKDLREDPIYSHIFRLFGVKNIQWEVIFGNGHGQHHGHQIVNSFNFTYVWRIDDDAIPEPDVLAKLVGYMAKEIGAVGGAVFEPGNSQSGGSGKLEDIFHKPNLQWNPDGKVYEVEHLYSSFLYKPKIVSYNLELSPVAHREETLFSHELKEKGYKLIVDTSIKTYHFRQPTGGIRSHTSEDFYTHDDQLFARQMETWGYKIISLDVGIGDHFVFLNILPDLMKKYKHLIIGCCYPEVFKDYKDVITILPLAITQKLTDDHVYKFMWDKNWKSSILNAYKLMFEV
jgi:GT2 family glycosyltransferase